MNVRARTKPLLLWARALWSWLVEARHFWLAVLVVVVATLFVVWNGTTEPEIRSTGLALQLLGLLTVALGIRKTRALFGHPGILKVSREWLRRFPVYGGRVVRGSAIIELASATMHARAYVSANAGPGASIEARLEALEKNVEYMNGRINETQTEMDQTLRAQAVALEQEQQNRAKENQEIHSKLEATETGGLSMSTMGVLWLSVGVSMSTLAPELAKWFP